MTVADSAGILGVLMYLGSLFFQRADRPRPPSVWASIRHPPRLGAVLHPAGVWLVYGASALSAISLVVRWLD